MIVDNFDDFIINHTELLLILLQDHNTGKNIIWKTKRNRIYINESCKKEDIKKVLIEGKSINLITSRRKKTLTDQKKRCKDNAEVFTPSWVCNVQINEVDKIWFGYKDAFNIETKNGWISNKKVVFDNNLDWHDYIDLERMEITCGEAPYLVSRYDAVSGKLISPNHRIGLLDRKLIVICQNTINEEEWIREAEIAYKRTYGYELQGDSLLLARENLFMSFLDFYTFQFHKIPTNDLLVRIATIISWNIWQMDGLKFVVPFSCHKENLIQLSFFPEMNEEPDICYGCKTNNALEHNGVYCKIKDWETNEIIRFVDLIK